MISLNENAAPVLQHQDGRGEQTLLPGVRCSMSKYTTGHSSGQVEGLLLHGVENAIPASELVRMLGLRNACELRCCVEYERKHGALILTLPAVGYRLPGEGAAGRQETRLLLRSMDARVRNTEKSTAAAALWLQQEDKNGKEKRRSSGVV